MLDGRNATYNLYIKQNINFGSLIKGIWIFFEHTTYINILYNSIDNTYNFPLNNVHAERMSKCEVV